MMDTVHNRLRPVCWLLLLWSSTAHAAEPQDAIRVRDAVTRGLTIVQTGAKNYPQHRDCFSCHHQTLPLMAMRDAREAGLTVDEALFKAQTTFTRDSFRSRKESLEAGKNVGGRGLTVGYGLWTLQIADAKPDDTTRAMVAYLLKIQEADGSWKPQSFRPPMSESIVTSTVLSAYGLQQFADESQKPSAKSAIDQARTWLATCKLICHEDQVFRLWGQVLLNEPSEERTKSVATILKRQLADGSWSQQLPRDAAASSKTGPEAAMELKGDAYATGQSLWVLKEAGLERANDAVLRGLKFLLSTQEMDGSWHVVTRAKPVQLYFDNGDPHGADQFISISATGWATAALARWSPP